MEVSVTNNLIHDPWIPVVRKSGGHDRVPPWRLTDRYMDDPVVGLDASRADFNGAIVQFLIGLVQTTLPPENGREWRRRLRMPPTPEELRTAFEPIVQAFDLDGDGARFMQDLDLSEGEPTPVDRLLMEMPGEQTLKKNIDHFQKRYTVQCCCLRCTGMALLTLQTNAPSGGRGHRTSLRGGGPLTTLVLGRTLWETVWLNTLEERQIDALGNAALREPSDTFPWLAPTRTSTGGEVTTSLDAHPLQMYWGMPRRIRLQVTEEEREVECDLCGDRVTETVTTYLTKDGGVNYKGGWRHPLTPHTRVKNDPDLLPRHGQPGGVTYRNWLGLVQSHPERGIPAQVVTTFREMRAADLEEIRPRLWAFGYDMDNMKARCWYEGTMPLLHVGEEGGLRERFEAEIGRLIRAAELVVSSTRSCIRQAWYEDPKNAPTGDLSFIDARFWQETEAAFYRQQAALPSVFERNEDPAPFRLSWLRVLRDEAMALFGEYSQEAQIELADPRRIARARRTLLMYTSPKNRLIAQALDLPAEPKTTGKRGRRVEKQRQST
ncbi:CRISPR-associated protein Cse1 [anaerobic digester metagenome]